MLWNEDVQFPKRYKPLPPGYKIVQLDSGHFMWIWGSPEERAKGDHNLEGPISWDRYWVRRCVFAHYEKYGQNPQPRTSNTI